MTRAAKACRVAAGVFGLVSLLHVWRLINQMNVLVGTWRVPMALSAVALIISGGLAWWLWNASRS